MPRGCEALTWLKYGQDEIPASLGITVGSEAQVSTQWRRLFKSVGDECAETLTHLKRELGPTARASLIWGAFVSKLPYMAGVPPFPAYRDTALDRNPPKTRRYS